MSGGRADYTLYWLYHPVRLIGLLITGLEQLLRKLFPAGKKGERAAGACLAVCTAAFTGLAVYGLLFFAAKGGNAAYFLVSVLLNYWLFAARSLRTVSMETPNKSQISGQLICFRSISICSNMHVEKVLI